MKRICCGQFRSNCPSRFQPKCHNDLKRGKNQMLQLPFVKDILFCLTAQNNFNIKVSTLAILKGPGIHKITNMSRKCLENIWKMTGICLENVLKMSGRGVKAKSRIVGLRKVEVRL